MPKGSYVRSYKQEEYVFFISLGIMENNNGDVFCHAKKH